MRTRIFSEALTVSTAIFLCLAQVVMAQGVISLPWTGQSKCYNESGAEISCAGTRQDGDVQAGVDWPSPRFTVSGDCVTDHLTGLMWAKNANLANKAMAWSKALDYVSSINSSTGLCGYKDWYLPNINELETLVNAGEANVATWLMNHGFANVQSNYYWSSTTIAPFATHGGMLDIDIAFPVDMLDGNINVTITGTFSSQLKSNAYYVWPVRSGQPAPVDPAVAVPPDTIQFVRVDAGATSNETDPMIEHTAVDEAPGSLWKTGQTIKYYTGDDGDLRKGVTWPSPRFIDHGDGTVTDNLAGLMWIRDTRMAAATTWQDALDAVKTLKTGKHSDWRLPNRKELFSLLDRSTASPALSEEAQKIFQNDWELAASAALNWKDSHYWTSTTNANRPSNAWAVDLKFGGVFESFSKSSNLRFLPVRSAQAPSPDPVISVTPNPVQFGTVIVGAILDKSATVKNAGGSNLVIGTTTSPSSPFTKTTDNCSGKTLPAGATCDVTYRFAPGSATTFNSNSNIPSNDPDKSTVTVTLAGTGTDASPAISVTPATYDFGDVKVKKNKSASFVVKNGGKTNLSVSSAVTGTDASLFPITSGSGNKTIKPGKTLTLKVGFKPTSKGSKSATLRISSNDLVTPNLDIPLSGTAQ